MLVPIQIQKDLKSVSIGGRMAMAVTCFENILRTLNLSSPSIEELIDIFWQFVETEEQALKDSFGEEYIRYAERTKRLIPKVY